MAARVFISYSHKDEGLRDQLEVQLAMLKRQGLVDLWHDRRLLAGDHLDWTISKELDLADIILLLVSPDFIASDYCYKIEKGRALDRHREGTARLISVILRPCDWSHTDLGQYLVTPRDGKPITQWTDRDEAFLDVARSIRRAIEELGLGGPPSHVHNFIERPSADDALASRLPRSSNLRLRKEFSQADEDRFVLNAFEYLDRFFQGSLDELRARNADIETRFRRVDANTFTAAIYRRGDKAAACTVRFGSMLGALSYSNSDDANVNTCNESLSVERDDQKLFLRPMGMPHLGKADRNGSLSEEGAAEYLWSLLIRPIQGN